ncbi:universal stress protein UspA [Thioalkalivibrio denitrificans]|uniref:Universal stress protein UspA n=1 Tax=Thioalkalivibrio denitrificans TaxID=108003 RepID=A0A1V3NFK1_9GAMM|nr:universal stress protein [Thioalkalivibrio denitrificans]OOG23889.1 universal stress protein UspA [Thioalkalivibrio denitrificans]
MFEHILVAVDFSPSWERLKAQLDRLRVLGCRRLTLVHVIASGYTQAPELTHRDHYQQRLDQVAESLRERDFEVETEVCVGLVAAELRRAAREREAGVILAGSHGHRILRDLLLGSTVLDLARQADRPLLLAPTDESVVLPGTRVCRPLLATDGSAAAAGAEAAFLDLLSLCQPGLVVSVGRWAEHSGHDDEQARIQAHVAELAERVPAGAFETLLPGKGRPAEEIARVAEERAADLIIVGKRGHNPMVDLLLGNTAEAVCRNARRLVLLVPDMT